ncbi:hypothetical protein DRP53_07645 [candidate division WOR-3 bacterium]|uniref:Protein kinase domain-containing protein n=1 Tax=candidate division WOR-3 bacterium TaxID=2052148 RepID=A0A660SFN9_UNCW3|nr:MAG: hypothetical protein DRP53_07645 [candidate division WOR-3 bacterium]
MARVEHLRRLQEILAVFVRFGFSQAIEASGFGSYLENIRSIFIPKKKLARLRIGQRLAGAFAELGPAFIKLGQFLSTRPDLIPESIATDLATLQDEAPPVGFDKIEPILKEELGENYRRLTDIDPTPLASASIAQVHRARLDGERVVIKIQKPDVGERIRTDLELLTLFARSFAGIIRQFRPVETIRIFEREIRRELNFLNEYRNILRFDRFFKDDPWVVVPKIYRELCTDKILVMEEIDGVKISDREGIIALGQKPKEIARRGAHLILRQLFEFGFFHGDPHPGNIMVNRSGAITLIDFGIVGYLDDRTKDDLAEILIGSLYQETRRIIYALEDLGVTEGLSDESGLERDIGELIDRIRNLPPGEIVLKGAIDEIISIVRSYELRFPPQLFLLGRSLAMIEEIGSRLDPQFDVVGELGPYVQRFLKRRYRAERMLKKIGNQWVEVTSLLKILPGSLRRILSRLAREEYRFSVDLKGTEPISVSIERALNRLSLSILSGTLVVAAVILKNTVARVILLIMAAILFLGVVAGMVRSRML